MKAPYFAAGLLFYLVFCSTNVVAAGATAGKARGSYRDWNVDAVTIVRPFRFSSYRQVVVLPLDTRGVRLPPREENTHQLAKEVLSTANELFLQGLKDNLRGANVDVIGGQGGRDGVLVRARLEKLDPGSISARMWAPGAGSAQTLISGDVLDGKTGDILFRFQQERRSVMRVIWQRENVLLSRTIVQIGGDIAGILKTF